MSGDREPSAFLSIVGGIVLCAMIIVVLESVSGLVVALADWMR